MDLGIDCRICTCSDSRISRAFYIKFENFQSPILFSRTF